MDDMEAKLRLTACRPGGRDADDPRMREALNGLARSPALNAWFEQQQAFDQAMADHVHGIPVPDHLRTELLAAARLSRPVPRWSRPRLLAAAAAIGLAAIMTGVLLRPPPQPTLAEYRGDIATMFAQMKERGFRFDERGADVANLNAFLVKHEAPPAETLQPGLRQQALPLGCHIIEWRGRKVSMICFLKKGKEAHLFVVDRDAVSDSVLTHSAHPERLGGYPIASWTDARHAYVLVGDSPETDLSEFL